MYTKSTKKKKYFEFIDASFTCNISAGKTTGEGYSINLKSLYFYVSGKNANIEWTILGLIFVT